MDPSPIPCAGPSPPFTSHQVAQLDAPLDRALVKSRRQAGRTLSYIEGWVVIAEANRIFGFDGWHRQTIDISRVSESPRKIGEQQRDGWGVTYVCRVRITVGAIVREGTGAGHGIDVDLGQAHESAIKEAETDAMKRAFMTFGNPFGLALYDKTQANVKDAEAAPAVESQPTAAPVRRAASQPTAVPAPPQPEAEPLPDDEIKLLIESVKDLGQNGIRRFTTEFRRAFNLPDRVAASSLIKTAAHRDWIVSYLTANANT